MPGKAAIDNDFLNHLLEIKGSPDLAGLIRRFFKALDVSTFMHPLVYNKEAIIESNKIRDALVKDNTIDVPNLSDLWKNQNGGKKYYEMMVRGIYKNFTGLEYPCDDVINGWKSRCSLGEVHTVVACAFLMCDCFLSDDKKASRELQEIVLRILNRPIKIFNRQDRCDYLRTLGCPEREGLSSKELNMLSHSR